MDFQWRTLIRIFSSLLRQFSTFLWVNSLIIKERYLCRQNRKSISKKIYDRYKKNNFNTLDNLRNSTYDHEDFVTLILWKVVLEVIIRPLNNFEPDNELLQITQYLNLNFRFDYNISINIDTQQFSNENYIIAQNTLN